MKYMPDMRLLGEIFVEKISPRRRREGRREREIATTNFKIVYGQREKYLQERDGEATEEAYRLMGANKRTKRVFDKLYILQKGEGIWMKGKLEEEVKKINDPDFRNMRETGVVKEMIGTYFDAERLAEKIKHKNERTAKGRTVEVPARWRWGEEQQNKRYQAEA